MSEFLTSPLLYTWTPKTSIYAICNDSNTNKRQWNTSLNRKIAKWNWKETWYRNASIFLTSEKASDVHAISAFSFHYEKGIAKQHTVRKGERKKTKEHATTPMPHTYNMTLQFYTGNACGTLVHKQITTEARNKCRLTCSGKYLAHQKNNQLVT